MPTRITSAAGRFILSVDKQPAVLKDCDGGMGTAAVAKKYSVSPAWVRRLKQRRRENGEVRPRQQRHGRIPATVTLAENIREAVSKAPDATLEELCTKFGLPISVPTLSRALQGRSEL